MVGSGLFAAHHILIYTMLVQIDIPAVESRFYTPVEEHGGFVVKRDDLFEVCGVQGGKARTCYYLSKDATGLVTASSRSSPQANIVAHVAKHLGIPCRLHIPQGELGPELQLAKECGAEIIQHRAGYNSVIISRARDDAKISRMRYIPFGMECTEAVRQTAAQVPSLFGHRAKPIKRIVIPVGSGMSFAGVVTGLNKFKIKIPVLGISVGASPAVRLATFCPFWKADGHDIVNAGVDYHAHIEASIGDVVLDPVYEAKCVPFLRKGDCLWIVGIRKSVH